MGFAREGSRPTHLPRRPAREVERRRDPRPRGLTIGYARRFASYKRLRCSPTQNVSPHPDRPLTSRPIVIAGKATQGRGRKELFSASSVRQAAHLRNRIVFVEDYDMTGRGCFRGRDVGSTPHQASRGQRHHGRRAPQTRPQLVISTLGPGLRRSPAGQRRRRITATRLPDFMESESIYDLLEKESSALPTPPARPASPLGQMMNPPWDLLPHVHAHRLVASTPNVYLPRPPQGGQRLSRTV